MMKYLNSKHFYFSPSYDLSKNIRESKCESKENSFWFNFTASLPFIKNSLGSLTTPFIMGFVEQHDVIFNITNYSFTLIGRKSRHRPGVRFQSRGINEEGKVSNFFETEYIYSKMGADSDEIQSFL